MDLVIDGFLVDVLVVGLFCSFYYGLGMGLNFILMM